MLFNTYIFIFAISPIVLFVFFVLSKYTSQKITIAFLFISSVIYYSYWEFSHIFVLIASIGVNYFCTYSIINDQRYSVKKWVFALGVVFNLTLLSYYKYTQFFLDNLNDTLALQWTLPGVLLPIGISFFTFQQIALLADARAGKVTRLSPLRHAFFVTFFPQLIAGPIVHHSEIMPQLEGRRKSPWSRDLAIGITIFAVGLFKKVVIADSIAIYADAGFDTVQAGGTLDFASAWITAFAYSFQIYYDFSGYSDMAVGLARMFGIRLPLNFFSPYRAIGFIEFWRRWHITLSRFLRDYLYIPLGGNRHGAARQALALAAVMLLGGLWHGAGWTFVLWGALHGMLLVLNHAWTRLPFSRAAFWSWPPVRAGAVLATFAIVTLVWVPFRAQGLDDTLALWTAMLPLDPVQARTSFTGFVAAQFLHLADGSTWLTLFPRSSHWPTPLPPDYLARQALPAGAALACLTLATLLLPNVYQMLRAYAPALHLPPDTVEGPALLQKGILRWLTALAVGFMLLAALLGLSHVSPFLYFQF